MDPISAILAFLGKIVDIFMGRQRSKQEECRHRERLAIESRKADALERIAVYTDGLLEAAPEIKDPFLKARQLEKEYKYWEAIKHYEACFQPETTASQRVALHILIGNCFYRLSELEEAEGHYREAETIAREANDKEGLAVALGNIGNIYVIKGELDKALGYYEDALKIFKEIGAKIQIEKVEQSIQTIKGRGK